MDAKRPLYRPLPPAPEFPIRALGPLRDPVEALQMRTQAPMAICAQSVLGAATLAVQAHRNVELPAAGVKPLTGLFASVAESGERKTTVDRIALAAVYRMEESWRETRQAEIASYINDRDAWKAAREGAVKKNRGDRAAIKAALDALGPEPKEPPAAMLLVSDPTPEALVLHLKASRPWAGLFTAEGGILLGGSAFNDETRMRTGALLNVLWDGEPIRRSRVGTGTTFLPGRRCSAHIMMQRIVADRLFGNTMLDGIGLLARFLTVAPDSTAGTRLFREPPPECRVVLDEYNARLTEILSRSPALASGTDDVLDPPAMYLSDAARRSLDRLPRCGRAGSGRAGRVAADPSLRREDGRTRRSTRGGSRHVRRPGRYGGGRQHHGVRHRVGPALRDGDATIAWGRRDCTGPAPCGAVAGLVAGSARPAVPSGDDLPAWPQRASRCSHRLADRGNSGRTPLDRTRSNRGPW